MKLVTKIKQHKNKIVAAAVILAVLAGAWLYGGNYSKGDGAQSQESTKGAEQTPPAAVTDSLEQTFLADMTDTVMPPPANTESTIAPMSETGVAVASASIETAAPTEQTPVETAAIAETPLEETQTQPPTTNSPGLSETQDGLVPGDITHTPVDGPTTAANPETGIDKYHTDPVPEGKPAPVEPGDATVGDGSFIVTLTVRCDTILNNMDMLSKEKWELVPEDGEIFPVTAVTAYEGESVFNVFLREMKRAKMHMTFRSTPIYNSSFIEAINNLYEFDAGELSGWLYSVNGWYPNYGCSRYQLQPGDVIEWRYTCDLGRDLGQLRIAGWQY